MLIKLNRIEIYHIQSYGNMIIHNTDIWSSQNHKISWHNDTISYVTLRSVKTYELIPIDMMNVMCITWMIPQQLAGTWTHLMYGVI